MKNGRKKIEDLCKQMRQEAQKYPVGDKRNLYYIGCEIGLKKALSLIKEADDEN